MFKSAQDMHEPCVNMKTSKLTQISLGLLIASITLRKAARSRRAIDFKDRVAVITGGSRGLGLAMARELARNGARLAICSRNETELERARQDLESLGAEVFIRRCNVASADQARDFIEATLARFGRIDIVINNAGIIEVGPAETMTRDDFADAMDVIFWGTEHVTMSALPHLRRNARIVNITSIGADVSIPHLIPYSAAKFAVRGFSEGLSAELRRRGIHTTTILPGLMRTGSARHALFKGKQRAEYAAFAIGGSLPLITIDAERAASQIVRACRYGDPFRTIGATAKVMRLFHSLLPGVTADFLGIVNRLLPRSQNTNRAEPGYMHETKLTRSPLTRMSRRAAEKLREVA